MSVFVMINKYDAPSFEKGDIITYREDDNNFGSKVNLDDFCIIEVTETTIEEAESLVLPLANYNENPDLQQDIKQRMLSIDVDKLIGKTKVTKKFFLSLITRKEIETDIQFSEIIA